MGGGGGQGVGWWGQGVGMVGVVGVKGWSGRVGVVGSRG